MGSENKIKVRKAKSNPEPDANCNIVPVGDTLPLAEAAFA